MDQSKFDDAQRLYDAGDYRAAAKGFLASAGAGRGSDASGSAYHMAGNSLMKLRRWRDAVAVYGHALRDQTYTKRGAVYANLGRAYYQLAEYSESVDAYRLALEESDYKTPHKALCGMADALLESGKVEDAAVAYRKAALEPQNPDPGKSLLNLGLCFMALGRPADAAEAYKAALGFDNYKGRGKALSNLGLAYAAMGEYEDAVRSFEKALRLHNQQLSPAAREAYESALRITQGAERETIEGWQTGEIPIAAPVAGASDGWDTGDLAAMPAIDARTTPHGFDQPPADTAATAAAQLGFGDDEAVTSFFAMTEDEMKELDREARKEARRTRREGSNPWKAIAWIAGLVVAAGLLLGGLYYFGFGWPTQAQTVSGLLGAHASGESVASYWVAVPGKDLAKEMAKVPPVEEFTVDSVVRGPQNSVVVVTVTPKKGSPLRYKVTMERQGVGWFITGIDNDWQSTGD